MRRLILLLLSPLVAAAAVPSPAGTYTIHQMEMAGGLELQPNGHFRYAFTYGAVDEESEGDWKLDGDTVRLTSKPMPKEPDFEVVRDEPAPQGDLILLLERPFQGWNGPLDGYVVVDGHEPYDLILDDEGRSAYDSRGVKSIILKIPVYGGLSSPIPISADRGHRLSLRFRPNDLGHAAFRDEPLKLDGAGLVMERYDTQIRFLRDAP